jgi:hypothetical protein
MKQAPLVLAGAFVTALLTFAYRFLSFAEFANDHFVHLSIAQQITRGALPVRDFVERGIPLMSMLSAGAQLVFGEGLRSELLLVAGAFALGAALTYVVAKRISGSIAVAFFSALLPVLVYPVSYSYPKLLAPAMVLASSWWYLTTPSASRLAAVAITVAISFLLRHDLGIFAGAGVAGLLTARHGWSRAWLADAAFAAGVTLLVVGPYLVWVQTYQGVGSYVRDGLAFSSREAQRANWWWDPPSFGIDRSRPLTTRLGRGPVVNVRWLPNASDASIAQAERRHGLTRLDPNSARSWQYELSYWSKSALAQLVTDPLAADTNGIDRSTFALKVPAPHGTQAWMTRLSGPGEGLRLAGNSLALVFYLVWLMPLVTAVLLFRRWNAEEPSVRTLLVMAIVMQLGMNVTMLRDPLETRIRDVIVPSAVLLSYLAGIAWWLPGVFTRPMGRTVACAGLFALVMAIGIVGDVPTQLARTQIADGVDGVRQRMRTIRRTLAAPDHRTGPRSPVYTPMIEYIGRCTAPDAKLWTLTFAPELFFYTGRSFAGGQVSLSPGYFTSDRDTSLMLERVSRESVPLVIMDSQTQGEMLKDYPRIGAYVTANYRETARFAISHQKAFVVLAKNGTTC